MPCSSCLPSAEHCAIPKLRAREKVEKSAHDLASSFWPCYIVGRCLRLANNLGVFVCKL